MSKPGCLLALSLIGSLLTACSSGNSGPDSDPTETESDSGVASDIISDIGSDTDCPVVTNCDRCLASCEGSHTCETFCYPDPCEPEPEYDPLTDPLLADYRWFNGEWDCLEGWDCYEQAVMVITVQSWDPELGAAVNGFFRGGGILYFKKNPDTGTFETDTPIPYGVARGQADVNSKQLVLDRIEDYGAGVQTVRGIFRKR